MSSLAHSSTTDRRYLASDRESFFDAQRRNRRATWRLAALCVAAVATMGVPLALLVTPLVYGVVLIVADILNFFSPLPPAFWRQATDLAHFGFLTLNWLLNHKPAAPQALALGAAVMLAPGAILSLVLWLGISALFRRAGVGGALLALNAREPNPAALKELQLADVVQEMAIAAGLPAPRVMLVDAPGANLAAIGSSAMDARIVVSRRLIDSLSRDELEGAVAHAIASIGNGDLRVAFRVTALLETYGVLVAMLNSPFGPQSRHTLWRILRFGLTGARPGRDEAEEAAAVAAILTRSVALGEDDIDRFFGPTTKNSALRSIRNFVFFPIFFTIVTIRFSLWFFSFAVLGPSIALLWRTRKYLADASAVQLTRDPDGLAQGLRKLNDNPGAIPGSGWASHLFFVSPASADRMTSETPDPRQTEILARAWTALPREGDAAAKQGGSASLMAVLNEVAAAYRKASAGDPQAMARIRALRQAVAALDPALAAQIPDPADLVAARKGDAKAIARLRTFGSQVASPTKDRSGPRPENKVDQSSDLSSASFLDFYPSLKRRLKRLERMGAHLNLASSGSSSWVLPLVISLIFAPLVLLLIAVFLLLIAVMTLASLTFLTIWLAIIHKIFALAAHQ